MELQFVQLRTSFVLSYLEYYLRIESDLNLHAQVFHVVDHRSMELVGDLRYSTEWSFWHVGNMYCSKQ
jgi:hypothetical protein